MPMSILYSVSVSDGCIHRQHLQKPILDLLLTQTKSRLSARQWVRDPGPLLVTRPSQHGHPWSQGGEREGREGGDTPALNILGQEVSHIIFRSGHMNSTEKIENAREPMGLLTELCLCQGQPSGPSNVGWAATLLGFCLDALFHLQPPCPGVRWPGSDLSLNSTQEYYTSIPWRAPALRKHGALLLPHDFWHVLAFQELSCGILIVCLSLPDCKVFEAGTWHLLNRYWWSPSWVPGTRVGTEGTAWTRPALQEVIEQTSEKASRIISGIEGHVNRGKTSLKRGHLSRNWSCVNMARKWVPGTGDSK